VGTKRLDCPDLHAILGRIDLLADDRLADERALVPEGSRRETANREQQRVRVRLGAPKDLRDISHAAERLVWVIVVLEGDGGTRGSNEVGHVDVHVELSFVTHLDEIGLRLSVAPHDSS